MQDKGYLLLGYLIAKVTPIYKGEILTLWKQKGVCINGLSVKTVNFMGDRLLAAKDDKGIIWTGVNSFCRGIGLSKNERDRQVKNIQFDEVLKRGCVRFDAGVFDSNNETLGLQLDYVPLWLAKISITPTMRENNPELVEKLVKYQLKAKDVLAAAFLPSYWQQTRQQAKDSRLLEAECIKEFVAYAKEQGSRHAERYYCSFTRLANKAAGIDSSRENATVQQLNNLSLIEHIIEQVLRECMEQEKPYKEIYLACKARVEQFQEIAYLSTERAIRRNP